MLTTNLYFDFGQAIGHESAIATTVSGLRNIAGPGISIDGTPALGTGPDFIDIDPVFVNDDIPLEFESFVYDWDNSGTVNGIDVDLLATAVVEKARQSLAPFDVEVVLVDNTSLVGINDTLDANDGEGEVPDVYLLLGNVYATLGQRFSLGLVGGTPFGIAARVRTWPHS